MLYLINDVAYVASTLLKELRRLGIPATLLQPVTNVHVNGKFRIVLERWKFLAELRRKTRKRDFLCVNYAYFGALARVLGRRYALHCHGDDLRTNSYNRYRYLTRYALKKAELILYSTPDLEAHVPSVYRSKAYFLPNPVNVDLFRPADRLPTPLRPQAPELKVLIISKLDLTKGVERLQPVLDFCEAFAGVSQVGMFNFGTLSEFPLRLGSKIVQLTRTPHEEMPLLINQFDVVIGQLVLGAIGVSELEALACAKPLICNFKFNHVYAEPMPVLQAETSEDVLGQIRWCWQNRSEAELLGKNGRRWVEAHHAPDKIANQFLNCLRRTGLDSEIMPLTELDSKI